MKSTNTEILKRIEQITIRLIEGESRGSIVQYASKKWNLSERQVDTYISKSKVTIENSIKRNLSYEYAVAINRYELLFKLNLEREDYKAALLVNKEIVALQGLLKQQLEHNGEIKFICSLPE